jgi:hypothetical protein
VLIARDEPVHRVPKSGARGEPRGKKPAATPLAPCLVLFQISSRSAQAANYSTNSVLTPHDFAADHSMVVVAIRAAAQSSMTSAHGMADFAYSRSDAEDQAPYEATRRPFFRLLSVSGNKQKVSFFSRTPMQCGAPRLQYSCCGAAPEQVDVLNYQPRTRRDRQSDAQVFKLCSVQ